MQEAIIFTSERFAFVVVDIGFVVFYFTSGITDSEVGK